MSRLLIVGAGGHGKVTLDCALENKKYCRIAFLADDASVAVGGELAGHPVLLESQTSFERMASEFDEFIIAIGDNHIRMKKTGHFIENGLKLATLIHPSAAVSAFAKISPGTVIFANAVVNAFAVIGRSCIINSGAVVEHDCVIGDGAHVSPKAALGGSVIVGQKSWLCLGSSVANNLRIGAETVIGAGAVVLHDVPDGVLAAGVPAVICKRYPEAASSIEI